MSKRGDRWESGVMWLGVLNKKHWNCCGSTNESDQCEYWKLIKTQDDSK